MAHRLHFRIVAGVLLLIAAGHAARSAGAASAELAAGALPEPSPLSALVAFEAAWSNSDVEALLASTSHEGLRLEMGTVGPDGFYARSQAEFLIRDLLAYSNTVTFYFNKVEWDPTNVDRGVSCQATWLRRGVSEEAGVPLYLNFKLEEGGWRLTALSTRDTLD